MGAPEDAPPTLPYGYNTEHAVRPRRSLAPGGQENVSERDPMPRPSQARRIAKWTGVVVCVVLVVAWPLTGMYSASYHGRKIEVGYGFGGIHLWAHSEPTSSPYGWAFRHDFRLIWAPMTFQRGTGLRLPIWILLLVSALPTAYLFWRDRRYPRGHCQGCGYDLTGNVSGVCPECGRAT